MKKLLYLLLLLITTGVQAQVALPDSTRQTGSTNFTPQFNFKGNNASTSAIQMYNPLNMKYFGIYSAYQTSQLFAPISGSNAYIRNQGASAQSGLFWLQGNSRITGTFNVSPSGTNPDAMGYLGVTLPYYGAGFARAAIGITALGAQKWAIGAAPNNALVFGWGPNVGAGATIDTVRFELTAEGNARFSGSLKSQHPVGTLGIDSIMAINSDGVSTRLAPDAFSTAVTFDNVNELMAYSGASNVAVVKDKLRGGYFSRQVGLTVDSGIVFPAAGGSTQWARLGNISIADAAWYGVSPDSTLNGLRLNNATHSPYVSTLNINFPAETLLVETPIYIENRANFVLNPNTTLKHPNEVPYALSATAASGATTIYIANANKKFLVNQTVGLYSTAAPIVGIEAGENWPAMSASRINAVFSDRIVLDSAIRYGYNIDSAAVAYNVSNPIVVQNATNITINKPKIDGNKAHAFYGYPMTKQTESDIANNGISLIGSTDVAINQVDISNMNLNGMKWTRNNYRVKVDGGVIRNPNGKGIISNYGGGDQYIQNLLVDSSRYNDGVNFNGDINGYTLNNIFVNNLRTRLNGRWGIRNQGSQTRIYIDGFTSINDGGVMQLEGEDSKASNITWKYPKDFRCGCNTVDAAIRILGARTIIDGFSGDSVGVPANFFRFEGVNYKVANGILRNMPSSVSSGKTVFRGLAGATGGQITNVTSDNIDATKYMRNNSGGAYFGDLASSVLAYIALDRPNFSGSSTNRNGLGTPSSPNSTISINQTTSTYDINLATANTWTGAQTFSNSAFPVVIERTSGAFGARFTRGGVEQGALFYDASNNFTMRNATGNFLTVASGSTRAVLPGGGSAPSYQLTGSSSGTITIQPQAAAGTYNFNLPTTAGTSGQVLTSGGGGSSPMTWSTLAAGTVTSVSSANADIGVATATTTPLLTLNSGTSANQIVKRDANGGIGVTTNNATPSVTLSNSALNASALTVSAGTADFGQTSHSSYAAFGSNVGIQPSSSTFEFKNFNGSSTRDIIQSLVTADANVYGLAFNSLDKTWGSQLNSAAYKRFAYLTDTATFIPKAWPSGYYTATGARRWTGDQWIQNASLTIGGTNTAFAFSGSQALNTNFSVSNTASNGDGPVFTAGSATRATLELDNYLGQQAFRFYGDGGLRMYNTKTGTVGTDSILVKDASTKEVKAVAPVDLINSYTGWATYTDNVYTTGSPFTVNSGVTSTLTNNAATVLNSQLPIGVTSFYNSGTSKITPENNGDSYLINVRFKARSNNASGLLDVLLDIGGALNVIDAETVSLRKGAGVEQQVNVIFDIYTAATFIANGGLIKVNSIVGNTEIYDIQYKITRTHRAR